jgi:hypothetical protein
MKWLTGWMGLLLEMVVDLLLQIPLCAFLKKLFSSKFK